MNEFPYPLYIHLVWLNEVWLFLTHSLGFYHASFYAQIETICLGFTVISNLFFKQFQISGVLTEH